MQQHYESTHPQQDAPKLPDNLVDKMVTLRNKHQKSTTRQSKGAKKRKISKPKPRQPKKKRKKNLKKEINFDQLVPPPVVE